MTPADLKELATFYAWLMSCEGGHAVPSDDPLVQSMIARWLLVRGDWLADEWRRTVPRRQASFTGSNSNG